MLATARARQHRRASFCTHAASLTHTWTAAASPSRMERTQEWLIKKHGAFNHDRTALGLSAVDHTSHFQTWLQLVGARQSTTARQPEELWRVAAQGDQTFFQDSPISINDISTYFTTLPMVKVCLAVQDLPRFVSEVLRRRCCQPFVFGDLLRKTLFVTTLHLRRVN